MIDCRLVCPLCTDSAREFTTLRVRQETEYQAGQKLAELAWEYGWVVWRGRLVCPRHFPEHYDTSKRTFTISTERLDAERMLAEREEAERIRSRNEQDGQR